MTLIETARKLADYSDNQAIIDASHDWPEDERMRTTGFMAT